VPTPNINKDRYSTPQYKRIRSGHKGIGRHNDLITWLYIQQQGRHFQRSGTGVREQGFAATSARL
jgi:hypothetical protein